MNYAPAANVVGGPYTAMAKYKLMSPAQLEFRGARASRRKCRHYLPPTPTTSQGTRASPAKPAKRPASSRA